MSELTDEEIEQGLEEDACFKLSEKNGSKILLTLILRMRCLLDN
jgi:hypothetical protein